MSNVIHILLAFQYLSVKSFILTDKFDVDCYQVLTDRHEALDYCLNDEDAYYDLRGYDVDFACW